MSKLKYIELILENCEVIKVPGKYVKHILVDGIKKDGYGYNLNFSDGWYSESNNTDKVEIEIDKNYLDNPFISFEGIKTDVSIYERLIRWKDITQIEIVNEEFGYKWFINPFKFIYNCFKNLLCFPLFKYSNDKKLSLKEKWIGYNRFKPIKALSKSCIHWKQKDSRYHYFVPWYWNENEDSWVDENGKAHDMDCTNMWQKVIIVDNEEESTTVRITIEREE